MKPARTLLRNSAAFVAIPLAAFLWGSSALATPILDTELASFAVLGSSTVTNTGPTILNGNLGVSAGSAITGFFGTVENDGPGVVNAPSAVHQADAFAALAQVQLVNAMTNLSSLGPGTLLGNADLTLAISLAPGVYSVPGGAATLSGSLTLDGQGNANAAWVFQIASTLTTASGSVINVINTGTGAGIYWNVGSSATLGTTTSFEGNILASASITLTTGATIGCGRALAHTGAVTLDDNTINASPCAGTAAGSNGFSGGLEVSGPTVTPLPFAPIPEPGTLLLMGSWLLGLFVFRRKLLGAA